MSATMLLKFISTVFCATIVHSRLTDCDIPLNQKNCGLRILVYTHNRPLSLCHAAVWKGCPTKNKFYNRNHCLSTCPKDNERQQEDARAQEIVTIPALTSSDDTLVDHKIHEQKRNTKCELPLNTNVCAETIDQVKKVYTFDIQARNCIERSWYRCPSKNMFKDYRTCLETCHNLINKESLAKLIKENEISKQTKRIEQRYKTFRT